MKKLILLALLLAIGLCSYAQSKPDTATQSGKAITVFLDCANSDMDYLRTEITYIDYVRDRMEAQVDVVVSTLKTGGGGTQYTFVFKGQKEFKGQNDTLRYNASSFVTDDGIRKGIAQTLKLGLIRYIAQTVYACKMNVSCIMDTAKTSTAAAPVKDKWNAWVYSGGVFGSFSGQQLTGTTNVGVVASASKVTEDWKISLTYNYNYNSGFYVITTDSTIKSLSTSQGFNGLYVKSMGQHFSLGINGYVNNNTFNNILLQEGVKPGIEYSIFPYSKATSKLFRLLYYVYAENSQYYDTTIYNKTHTLLLAQELIASITYKEPWGSLYTSLDGTTYFYDFSKNSLQFSVGMTLNLFEGFTLAVGGYATLVNNQIFLPANSPTEAQILLSTKVLPTPYQYYTFVGIRYTFGSIYNSIVNPRFSPNSFNVNFSF